CAWWRRAWRIHRGRDQRRARARPGIQGEIRDRSRQSLSERLHRPCQSDAQGRQRGRGAAISSAWRRKGTADPTGRRRQVFAQRTAWRVERNAKRSGVEIVGGIVQGQNRFECLAYLKCCHGGERILEMTSELAGKVAIVTGAGRNIGRAIALALADGGASILVNVRSNRAEAEAVTEEIVARSRKAQAHIGD